jgi:hypothetical protein
MKIFIDFDDVIFNAKKFKEDLIRVFMKYGVTRHDFENSYYTYPKIAQEEGKYYYPKDQIRVLKKRNTIDGKKLGEDIDKMMKDLRPYVFPDVYDFISNFSKKDLFLLTYGHEKFQLAKIRGAQVRPYFRKTMISKDNKINIIRQTMKEYNFSPQELVVFIDDRPEQLERTEKVKKSIVTFRMCRPEGRYSNLICVDKDWEVKNFKEIAKIIKREGMK